MIQKKKLLASLLVGLSALSLSAQNLQKGTYGYLYCHMSDNGEFTAYALSRDGLHYHDLNEGKAIMDASQLAGIEGGQRDAYVCRKSDSGKGYLMVTTDMC
ncbi:MAG: alpha-N-arabinofuranosidase, partial [Bacteroidaceae bacterium]|nr:alpha-N-arabinofuranosidase [Bacteroidaceae bacterium]